MSAAVLERHRTRKMMKSRPSALPMSMVATGQREPVLDLTTPEFSVAYTSDHTFSEWLNVAPVASMVACFEDAASFFDEPTLEFLNDLGVDIDSRTFCALFNFFFPRGGVEDSSFGYELTQRRLTALRATYGDRGALADIAIRY